MVTLDAIARNIVDVVRRSIPDADVRLVDAPIMNQRSHDVANNRFRSLGFDFRGDLARDVGAIDLLRNIGATPSTGASA